MVSGRGQLGDGRAINLGATIDGNGERQILQLKGAGPTPYSRSGDGLAVLRSSVREFLCSEAMHHLRVPTTRALSLCTTGESVMRDMFYDGNAKPEPGAVVCRVSRSFTRFGNFELCASRGELELLRALAEHTLRSEFGHLDPPPAGTPVPAELFLEWLREVCNTTAHMVAEWMRVGFVHGVMNTDNMSILGETIDYGPYGWLEGYEPNWTPNTTDAAGRRYSFGNQPAIAHWNLTRLAGALVPLIGDVEPVQEVVDAFPGTYDERWRSVLVAKLGLGQFRPGEDEAYVDELFAILQLAETDKTIFFRQLGAYETQVDYADDEALLAPLADAYYVSEQLTPELRARTAAWLRSYLARLSSEGTPCAERAAAMNQANPRYVLRNYLAQQAIEQAEAGDPGMLAELHDVLRRPYDDQPGKESFAAKRPEWARNRPGCSTLSCSS